MRGAKKALWAQEFAAQAVLKRVERTCGFGGEIGRGTAVGLSVIRLRITVLTYTHAYPSFSICMRAVVAAAATCTTHRLLTRFGATGGGDSRSMFERILTDGGGRGTEYDAQQYAAVAQQLPNFRTSLCASLAAYSQPRARRRTHMLLSAE